MGQFSREDCNREVWEGWVRIRPSMNWTRNRWEGDILDIHALAMQRKRGRELDNRFCQEAGPSVRSVIRSLQV